MNISEKIQELNLPYGSFFVVGSGILNALGIRESGDIDMIVSDSVYQKFEADGWQQGSWPGQTVLQRDEFELGRWWDGKTVDELLKTAQVVDGIPYLNLDDVYTWKNAKGREKDLRDLKLIDEYRAQLLSSK